MTYDCQVGGINPYRGVLECPVRESGGYRCEVRGPHTEHALGRHTKEHALAGNGYLCATIERELRKEES
jgi:hypothetical protein